MDAVVAPLQEPRACSGSGWRLRELPLPGMQQRSAGRAVGEQRLPAQQPQPHKGSAGPLVAAAQPTGAALKNPALRPHGGGAAPDPGGTARPNGPHDVASALGLMAVALIFMPLLLLLGHAEVATFGLVAGIARLTSIGPAVAAAAHRWRGSGAEGSSSSTGSSTGSSISRSSSGRGSAVQVADGSRRTGAAGALGYVLPLPHQAVLQLAAAGAVLLPLGLGLGAALWSAASGAPCSRWLKAALLYGLGLVLPSPGVGRRVQLAGFGAEAVRAVLLCGAGWLVAAETSVAAAGAAVAGGGAPAAVARLWLWLVGVTWGLQILGWLEASW